ncbi:MAG: sulfotransferase [Planctomycetota bacterium]
MQRVPLVYILSNGRSGSTLLDLLLGAHPEAWSVGELQMLPFELDAPRDPCGCGAPVAECEFWRPFAERVSQAGPAPLHHFRERARHGRVLRPAQVLDALRGAPSGARRDQAEAYGEHNEQLLRAIHQAAETRRGGAVRWLVDASKDPYRLAWLARSGRFDLRVIHLTKDPRAFVHSMTRDRERPGAARLLRFTGRWVVENAIMRLVARRTVGAERVRAVRYEDLAGAPERTLAELGEWLDLEGLEATLETFREVENHAVGGNEMRWRAGRVRLDERWRSRLTAVERTFVAAASQPLRRAIGYR